MRYKEKWKSRNDSSAINDLLHPDYHFDKNSPKSVSAPNMRPSERIVIPSKNLSQSHCTCTTNRRPVKECYCNVEIRKVQSRSSPRTKHKSAPCCNYKNQICYVPSTLNEDNSSDISPPISCETIRRVQKINYTPRSQFLRNVQKKVSVLKNIPSGECPEVCARSSFYHKLRTDSATKLDTRSQSLNRANNKSKTSDSEKLWDDIVLDEEKERYQRELVTKLNKGVQVPSRKSSKTRLLAKRTISSKKSMPERRREKSEKNPKTSERKPSETYRVCPGDCERVNWILTREKDDRERTETSSSNEVKELNKFRKENYFDTHGSSQTLVSSKSSGSLEQYKLNDRLFAEPVRKIHKNDLMLTLTPCATLQKKRIHYFPRYIIPQEKSSCNTNYKKKRYQTCPLTGHAIDLGITKPRPVLNSLALKYQKRLP